MTQTATPIQKFELISLEPNTRFIIPTLERQYRNLKLSYASPSSALVTGERRDGDSWVPLGKGYTISSTTEVVIDDSIEVIETSEKKEKVVKVKGDGKRGRKKTVPDLTFPIGVEFTIRPLPLESEKKMVALSTLFPDVDYANINNKLRTQTMGKLSVVRNVKSSSGRGKPTNVYMIN